MLKRGTIDFDTTAEQLRRSEAEIRKAVCIADALLKKDRPYK